MEPQTRIGTGSAALIAVVALLEPHLPLIYAIPIYSFLGAVTLWGFWPLIGSLSLGRVTLLRVPIGTAAMICFEKSENTFIGTWVRSEWSTEHDRLSFFVSSFIAHRLPMFGRVPPARHRSPIPEPAMRNLALVERANDLHRIAGREGVAEYRDVCLRRLDLWRHIRRMKRARRVEDF